LDAPSPSEKEARLSWGRGSRHRLTRHSAVHPRSLCVRHFDLMGKGPLTQRAVFRIGEDVVYLMQAMNTPAAKRVFPPPPTTSPTSGMRTGPELILATKAYARDQPARSWWALLSTAALLATSLAGTIWNFHSLAQLACSIVSGLLMIRLFVIFHDQQHHAILPHSQLAEDIMRVFSVFILSPSSIWRSSHNHHHNHNSKLRGSHIGSFPVMTSAQYAASSRTQRFNYLATRHPLAILFGYFITFLYGMCIAPALENPRKHWDCILALFFHVVIAIYLYLLLGWKTVLLTQTIPHFIMMSIGTYLFYAQHNFPDVMYEEKSGWTYEKAALESSSYLRTGRVMAWFTGNIGYHHIHHLNAKIPFYRLPEVMAAMPELQSPKTTSFHPFEILRCLRLKVWDVSAQRMTGLPTKS
jgi:acyl-lipid omega-6 desaturase (Delta-12 desaturase)